MRRPVSFRDPADRLRPVVERGGRALVVGMGSSGVAAASFLAEAGCEVTLNDRSPHPVPGHGHADAPALTLHPAVRTALGGHPPELFRAAELVVLSPGVPTDLPPAAEAAARGVPVIGEMELAYRVSALPWVAVTGSNGKSTVTTLIGLFAERGGVPVRTGGNLGTPAIELVRNESGARFIVAEVSSFQLETTETFRPAVGLLLNLSPDHLDRYPDQASYYRAKALQFSRMRGDDVAVFNLDDPPTVAMAESFRCRRFPFSRRRDLSEGACLAGETLVVREGGKGGRETPILPRGEVRMAGGHNLENALAASAAARLMGVPAPALAEVLRSFGGLPHRMELVARVGGVPVYNDSKGTNVGATEASLAGLTGPVILIVGGKDKGAPYAPLAPLVREKVKLLVLLGEAAPRIEEELGSLTATVRTGSLAEAVRAALDAARPGDLVLLSPACSSFDMFSGYEERGDLFRALVRKEAEARA